MKIAKYGMEVGVMDYTIFNYFVSLIFYLGYLFLLGYSAVKLRFPKACIDYSKECLSDWIFLFITFGIAVLFLIAVQKYGSKWEKLEDTRKKYNNAVIRKIHAEARSIELDNQERVLKKQKKQLKQKKK